jgi:hypothetical protein
MDWVVSQLVSLRFLRFRLRKFQGSWERSWEFFVLLLISSCLLVAIQFRDRVACNLCVP